MLQKGYDCISSEAISVFGIHVAVKALPSYEQKLDRSSKRSFTLKLEPSARLDLQNAVSIPGFEANFEDEDDCGICLDEAVNVGISGCSHKLCVDCALRLCQV